MSRTAHPPRPRRLSPCVMEARASARGRSLMLDPFDDGAALWDHAIVRQRALAAAARASDESTVILAAGAL